MAFVDLVTDAPDAETRELFDQDLAHEPDEVYGSLEPGLRDALAVGRSAPRRGG